MDEETWQDQFEKNATFGQRAGIFRIIFKFMVIADAVDRVGGSWRFVIGLLSFLVTWMAYAFLYSLNLIHSLNKILSDSAWDPEPFILLNLMLSAVASFQGTYTPSPIMSNI